MLLTETEARAICEKLLSYVKADDAVVNVNSENYGHLRFAANAFTTSGARENVTVSVTAWIGGKRGSATTNEIDDESLKAGIDLSRAEGIIPALESAHAVAALNKFQFDKDDVIVVNLSGRGDKDLETYIKWGKY